MPPCCATIQELSGRLHFRSVGRYAINVRPFLVDNIRFRRLNILPSVLKEGDSYHHGYAAISLGSCC